MAYSVTSWFLEQTELYVSEPKRVFMIGASDYSDRVLKWPTISRQWDQINPARVSLSLGNEDNALSFFKSNKTLLTSSCQVQFGYTHPTSGDELITVFAGTVEAVTYQRGALLIKLMDKIKSFTERVVGDSDNLVSYTGSNYLPSDIAWWLATSYGGLSTVASNSNPDIDYPSFKEWAEVFSGDSIFVQAEFDGQKVGETMSKISRMTNSAIYVESDKLFFKRFTESSSENILLSDDQIKSLDLTLRDQEIVNRQYVFGDYDTTSKYWLINVLDIDAESVNSYGPREAIIKDENLWYVNSTGCLNLAQRLTLLNPEPAEKYRVIGTLVPFARQIGETIRLVDSFHGVDSGTDFRLMSYQFNLDRGESILDIDQRQLLTPFVLDDDVNGLLDQDYNLLL